MIEFLCPNGHRIRCSAEQAGRAAKCPRCGVKFRIPAAEEAQVSDPADSGSDASEPELTDSGIRPAVPEVPDQTQGEELQIEFLCPAGHRLHGPASLQGRPGECPECGSRFHIPSYDDVSEEEQAEREIGIGRADGSESDVAISPPQATAEEIPSGQDAGRRPTAVHPMAEVFGKLWARRSESATVELHFANGETFAVDSFARKLSQHSHAVFAVKEPDGTHTLTAVAWESIVRVLVRGVKELPEEMSD